MSFSQRLFKLLLVAYPGKFRREYGPEMAQVFRDCCRATENRGTGAGLDLLLRTLTDLLVSVPREHLATLRKDNSEMNNWQRNLTALGASLAIIVVAFFLLSYGRSHGVASILFFGHTLDALVTAGIAGNLIIFLLRITKLNPTTTALWTMAAVNCLLALLAWVIGSRVDPNFSVGRVLVAYVISFFFWFGLHWAWLQTGRRLTETS